LRHHHIPPKRNREDIATQHPGRGGRLQVSRSQLTTVGDPTATDVRARGTGKRAGPSVFCIAIWLIMVGLAMTGCGSGTSKHTSSAQSSSSSSDQVTSGSATTLIETGIAQATAKQYQQAETTFRDVLVLSPGNKFAWYNLGLIAQVQNRASEAIADYSKAIASDPTYTPAMYNMAILMEATNLHAALALYQRTTRINPKAATAFLRESFVYARLGDKASAAQARARAVALDPSLARIPSPASK
jgi:tetratricopeptide (TPR) repeat protein